MFRIAPVQPEDATDDVRRSFDAAKAAFGAIPNGVKVLGASPSALRAYLRFAGSLASGSLSKAERERLAVLTAQRNECGYCLSAHTLAGRAAGLSEAELFASRQGDAGDQRSAALLRFAGAVIDERGAVSDSALAAARDGGLTDGELLEVVAEIALNTFTNYANRLADPEYDFPQVSLALRPRAA
jgi:uncharacterized peroxidase-related enzyme